MSVGKTPCFYLGTSRHRDNRVLREVVMATLKRGDIGFDTAPSYKTQRPLFQALLESGYKRADYFISDKIDAWQMQDTNGGITPFVDEMLATGIDYYDLLLIHWPINEYLAKTWESFIRLKQAGKVRHIGICNARERHLKMCSDVGMTPEFLQSEIHPLRTHIPMIRFCRNLKMQIVAHTPTGRLVSEITNTQTVKELCEKYGKTATQIILRWHLQKNISPVFMTTKSERIAENTDVFDFSLADDEMLAIDRLDRDCCRCLESGGAPGL